MDFSDPETADRETIENAVLQWRGYREQRLEAERAAAVIKKQEDFFKSFILEAFRQQQMEGVLVGGRLTGLTTRSVPAVADKEKLLDHIMQTGELDLLQFRLSASSVKERWDEGEEIPGVEPIDVYDVFDRRPK